MTDDREDPRLNSAFSQMSVSASNPLSSVHSARGSVGGIRQQPPQDGSNSPQSSTPTGNMHRPTGQQAAMAYSQIYAQQHQQRAQQQQQQQQEQQQPQQQQPLSAPASVEPHSPFPQSSHQSPPPSVPTTQTSNPLADKKPSASYLGTSSVQAKLQAFQQSRQRSNSASSVGNFQPGSIPISNSPTNQSSAQLNIPNSPHQNPRLGMRQELSRSPSTGSASSGPRSYGNSSTNSPVLSPLTEQQQQQQQQQQHQPPQVNQNADHLAPPETVQLSSSPQGVPVGGVTGGLPSGALAGGALTGAAANGASSFSGPLAGSGAQLQSKKPSLSQRRNTPKLSQLNANDEDTESKDSVAPLQSGGKPGGRRAPPPALGKLPQQPKSIFSNYEKYVNVKKGELNFEGKASLRSSGIEFLSGGRKKQYNITLADMEALGELGRGNYGTVTHVLHKPTGVEMAMKEIRLELDEAKFEQILMELEVLHRCQSPHVVDFYGAFFVEGAVFICMEYMNGGSLDKVYQGGVPEPILATVTRAVVEGLGELKSKHNIIHRDVKPTNILVSTNGKIKLCDFGVSGRLVASIAKTNIGCQSYMAPERISLAQPSKEYTIHSDIWSLGLSILEVAQGSYPYPPESYGSVFSQLKAIVDGNPPQLGNEYSTEAQDFVSQCLNKNPKKRPEYSKLLQHAWLNKFDTKNVDVGAFVQHALEQRDGAGETPRPALHNGRAGNE